MSQTTGRNDPCPCGSGKKYKKCCLAQEVGLPKVRKKSIEAIFTLSEAEKKVLCDQIIDENAPGTILRDFQTLLDFIQSNSLEASSTHHLLPLKALPVLNAEMSRPITLDLKRPQAKSYPHLQALYLLVRMTGLATIQHQGGKPLLRVNESALQSWESLNPIERYFTLLETWLVRGDFGILGESQGWGLPLRQCLRLPERLPPKGLQIAGNQREEENLRYSPGFYHLAFLELFGFIFIEHGKPLPGGGWRVLKLRRNPFGDVFFKLIKRIEHVQLFGPPNIGDLIRYHDKPETPFGLWQPIFKPFFPAWQSNFAVLKAEFRTGVYIFKVSHEQKIWRRIAIPAEESLDDLAHAILYAFDFDSDHLYEFLYKNYFGKKVSAGHPNMDADLFASEILIGDAPIPISTSMVFHYDFGDDWRFDVLLERIEPSDPKIKQATPLETYGKAPDQYAQMEW